MYICIFLSCQLFHRGKGDERRTSEKTSKSLDEPSGLNLTTLAASLPEVDDPSRASPVTGSTRTGICPCADGSEFMGSIKSDEKDGEWTGLERGDGPVADE
jgi:hypothetical protein